MYGLDNPLRYVDPDGRKIVNANSIHAQRIRSSLMHTDAGIRAWNRMKASPVEITLGIYYRCAPSSARGKGHVAGRTIGTYIIKNGQIIGGNATITLYPASAKQYMKSEGYRLPRNSSAKTLLDVFLNIVGVHESIHPEVYDNPDTEINESETEAEKAEKEAVDELIEKMLIIREEKEE